MPTRGVRGDFHLFGSFLFSSLRKIKEEEKFEDIRLVGKK